MQVMVVDEAVVATTVSEDRDVFHFLLSLFPPPKDTACHYHFLQH